jgi:acyl-[acyl-carrier-protein]-phospholipid O-acyltransferase/long-chain-fatty-acid--[acyl-carrier-protein] ligase
MRLMLSRRFAPLFWCQFFSAFNDNFLKTALVFLILFRIGGASGEVLITLAGAVFIAPYFFLSALGGELADRYDKARVAQWLKGGEIAIALLAIVGFTLSSVPTLFVALFGFGVIAALFGPIKYGILPDHLQSSALPAANALVEGATFIAILTGTITAGYFAAVAGATVIALTVALFALACWLSSLFIPPTRESAPDLVVARNIFSSTGTLLRQLRGDGRLWWGALVTSWFWLAGIVTLSLLPPLIKTRLGGDEHAVTVYLALFSVAVGCGSALAAILSHGRIVLGITIAGGVVLGIAALDLGLAVWGLDVATGALSPGDLLTTARGVRVACDLAGIAIGGGLYIVPVFAAVQAWAGANFRARTVAAVNILNAAFMTGATVLVALLQSLGVTIAMLFAAVGVLTLVAAALIRLTVPANIAPQQAW